MRTYFVKKYILSNNTKLVSIIGTPDVYLYHLIDSATSNTKTCATF